MLVRICCVYDLFWHQKPNTCLMDLMELSVDNSGLLQSTRSTTIWIPSIYLMFNVKCNQLDIIRNMEFSRPIKYSLLLM
ncbi:hypothetical protein XENTR_v10000609 [Xenopus tropicalis]|nr:hypothetical protein XENTR_v10000609 [Xenopus tropicalis]